MQIVLLPRLGRKLFDMLSLPFVTGLVAKVIQSITHGVLRVIFVHSFLIGHFENTNTPT
jgi:hypothetical protein